MSTLRNSLISLTFTTTEPVTVPIYALISNKSQINSLSTLKLNIHNEVIYSETLNAVTTTYKNEFDYDYSK